MIIENDFPRIFEACRGKNTETTIVLSIAYLEEAETYFIDINQVKLYGSRFSSNHKYTRTHIETIECSKSSMNISQAHRGYTAAAHEASNPKSGVDVVEIYVEEFTNTRTVGSWPNIHYEITHTHRFSNIRMLRDGELHHNYKPASIDIDTGYIRSVVFAKNGKECIPPERKFPSSITLGGPIHTPPDMRAKLGRAYNARHSDKALLNLMSRVPKVRWSQLDDLYKEGMIIQTNFSAHYKWEDTVIPDDILSLVEWPLDDVDMFTIMMAL